MNLGTRSQIAIAAAALTVGALLTSSTPAAAYDTCTVDWCVGVVLYYSDSTYTQLVGERSYAPCGAYQWGETTRHYVETRAC